MKIKKLFTLLLFFSSLQAFGQFTLVKKTDKKLEPIILANGDWMLVSENSVGYKLKSLTLYKSDLSIYKTVSIPQVFPHDTINCDVNNCDDNSIFLSSVDILGDNSGKDFTFTDNFFNSDSKIEIILTYRSRKIGVHNKETILIINEDSQEVMRFYSPRSIIKISYWKYLNVEISLGINSFETKMYSIPGNLPCLSSCNQKPASISPIDPSNAVNKLSIEGFPNPTSEKITLAYTLPKGSSYGTIRLYSQTGTLVKEFKVSDQFDHLELPVADYAAGTYFYELQVDGNSSGGKKMLVVH
jgi:hypothetical protein